MDASTRESGGGRPSEAGSGAYVGFHPPQYAVSDVVGYVKAVAGVGYLALRSGYGRQCVRDDGDG